MISPFDIFEASFYLKAGVASPVTRFRRWACSEQI